ncbi:MAG: phosphoribosylformylglycinamidine synthase I [Candidatus Margulisiibacteriota bacterium]
MTRIAVIQFPGSNCEYETVYAIRAAGMDADILRWNCEESTFHHYDGYVLPGGFSYQDRVRAGAIAAKLPIMAWLIKADQAQKPILGICNGCQILAESGIVPNVGGAYQIEMALAANTVSHRPFGFICDWVFVRAFHADRSRFTQWSDSAQKLPIPVNHGEGRFVFAESISGDIDTLAQWRYVTVNGKTDSHFPTNPNGATLNIAGIANRAGNALAIMPHPERAAFSRQLPSWVHRPDRDTLGTADMPGPWTAIFESLKQVTYA